MSSGPRIGEILLLREALDPLVLSQATQDQPASGQRLVSLLISRAEIDPDDGTLALSEQLGYPGAMQRHLERRDPAVAELIRAEVARRWVVLPLGRSRRGALLVAARDPSPSLVGSLAHITKLPIELAVTPAIHLERLIRSLFGELLIEAAAPAAPRAPRGIDIHEFDDRFQRDPRGRTVSRLLDASPELPRSRATRSVTKELDATLIEIDRAVNRAAAELHAFTFASQRWQSVLLVHLRDGVAFGHRGHGPRLDDVSGLMLPLEVPSSIQVAVDTRAATDASPASALQLRLNALLGDAASPSAAPIVVFGEIVAVLVAGDLTTELRSPLIRLTAIADAIGAAYQRLDH